MRILVVMRLVLDFDRLAMYFGNVSILGFFFRFFDLLDGELFVRYKMKRNSEEGERVGICTISWFLSVGVKFLRGR